jgi:hypothetical protein
MATTHFRQQLMDIFIHVVNEVCVSLFIIRFADYFFDVVVPLSAQNVLNATIELSLDGKLLFFLLH